MSYEFYKVLHVFSVLVLFSSLGTLAVSGLMRQGQAVQRMVKVAHGIALVLIFVAGFGLMARLGMFGAIPGWAWAKIGIWLLLGLLVLPMRRKPELAAWLWLAAPALGGLAAWLAIRKPF